MMKKNGSLMLPRRTPNSFNSREFFTDLTRILVNNLREWRAASGMFLQSLFEQIREMPVVNMLREKVIYTE